MKLSTNIAIIVLFSSLTLQAQHAPCGIGVDVVITHWTDGNRLQIVGVCSNSPAAQSGLATGQTILAINGAPTSDLKTADCIRLIQGEADTKIELIIGDWRHGWTNSITLIRRYIPGDPLSVNAAAFEIPESLMRKSISVTTNQLIQVLSSNETITVIQFTNIGPTNAIYRWRSRPANGGMIRTGSGSVFEKYESHVDAYGEHQLIYSGNPDNLFVKAGNVRIEWSVGGPLYGWLYYCPSNETVIILNSLDFYSDNVWSTAKR